MRRVRQSAGKKTYRHYFVLPALSIATAILGPVTTNALADALRLHAATPKTKRGQKIL